MKFAPYSYQYIQRSWTKATCSCSSEDSVAIVIRIHNFKDMKWILFPVLYLKVRYYTILFWQGKETISRTKKEGKKRLCLWLQDSGSGWTSSPEFLPSYLCLLLNCPNKYYFYVNWNSVLWAVNNGTRNSDILGRDWEHVGWKLPRSARSVSIDAALVF